MPTHPSIVDLLMQGTLPQNVASGQRIGTPPFLPPGVGGNPNPVSSGVKSALGKADDFLSRPSGNFLINLLAQSGYSTTPQSPFGAIGRAALATQQQQQASSMQDVQRRLIESQIGRNRAFASAGGNPTASNVQSVFRTKDGKLGIVRRSGEVEVTEQELDDSYQLTTLPSGETVATNRRDPRQTVPVVDEDVAVEGAARRKRVETEAAGDPERQRALPVSILRKEQQIDRIDGFIEALEDGRLDTGLVEGKFSRLTPIGQDFQSFTGQEVINLISSATFGQLSEGEREFLTTVTFSLDKDEPINKRDLQRMKEILQKTIEIERKDVERLEGQDDEFAGFSIARE